MLQRQSLFTSRDARLRRDPPVGATPAPAAHAPAPAEPARASDTAPAERASATSKTEEPAKSRLIVGPDIKLKSAEICDCDTLVVEGRIEATTDARVMQIAEAGTIVGTVSVDIAEVRGRFEGELTVRKTLVIHPTGKVSGKIRYGKIIIEEGGELAGEVGTLAAAKPAVVLATSTRVAESAERS